MKKYILNDNKKIIFLKNNEILIESGHGIRIDVSETDYKSLSNICSKYTIFEKENISKDLFLKLYKNKIIIEANKYISESYKTRYERNELFASNFFKNKSFKLLSNKTILFVGVGGIASIIIDQLISVGIKYYSIIDFDIVDSSNLNRQFVYSEEDIGKYKVDQFKKYILSKNKNALVNVYNIKINSSNQIETIISKDKIDFIINSADMPPCYLQKYIIECSIKSKVPCIFGGVGINEGSYGPLLDNKWSKINELKKINSILEKINYYFPCKSSFGITNSLVSNFMAWDIIMYLMNEKKLVRSLNEVINIDFRGKNNV